MTNIGIAYYSPEEYAKLLLTADDASELEDTWEEWYQNMQNTRNNLAALGILCSEVPIQIEALQKYCQEHNLKIMELRVLNMSPRCCNSSRSSNSHSREG
jgi:hypothetical protein